MPRKNKHNANYRGYVKPDYHSQNKRQKDDSSQTKTKLRTSLDIYKRLIHDEKLGIDLNYVSIGYKDTEQTQEMPLLEWQMIQDGGDIPMHRISYFVLYLMDQPNIIIWDKKTKLDRLFCSGETDKNTQSLQSLLAEIHHSNDEHQGDEKTEPFISPHHPMIIILDELITIFDTDTNEKRYNVSLRYNKKRVIQEPVSYTRLNRNEYKIIASKTKQIMENECFIHPKTHKQINIKNEMEFSYENSELYSQKHAFSYIDIDKHKLRKYDKMEIEINHETTLDCAYRLTSEYGAGINIVMLNFSSARNPGGGWDTGALAQEESIARSSALIPTLIKYETEFYEYHKARKTMLYSHALIYSPDVVIMKHGNGIQIERDDGYYKCNVITSPAVNAKMYVKRAKHTDPMMKKYGELNKMNKGERISEEERKNGAWNVVECVMRERCKRVLELAMKYDNEYVILGAWGCGVFGNDAMMIARIFAELLRDRYHNVFRKVVFAILDHKKLKPLDKFVYQFQNVLE